MNIEIITYHVVSGTPKPGFEWVAYVVLPNGEYWGVRFNGSTEELVRSKATRLWAKEQERFKRFAADIEPEDNAIANPEEEKPVDPWANAPSGRGHHFAGKVWMRHETEGLKRVPLTEIALYEKNGYYRSGPRSK